MRPLLASLLVCLFSVHAAGQTVGMLGDWQKIEFEGLEQVDAEEIRTALSWSLEFQAAARPSASIVELLNTTKERISEGFRQYGYLNAKIEVEYDQKRDRIVVFLDEGKRYAAGEIRVSGLDDIEADKLLSAINTPRMRNWAYRIGDKLIGKTETVESNNQSQQETKSAGTHWDKLGGSPFNPILKGHLQEKVWIACADFGFPYVKPDLIPRIDESNQTVDLELDLMSENDPAKLSSIEIQGLTRHTQQEVLEYLKLQAGAPFSAELIDRVYEALRQSCRFYSHEIEVAVLNQTNRYGQKDAEVNAVIYVVEYTEAPKLSEALSATEQAMYQFSHWLESYGAGERDDGDLVLNLKEESEATKYKLDLVVAPMSGWIGHVKGNLGELELDHCILNRVGNFAIYNWGQQRRLSAIDSLPSATAKLKAAGIEDGEFKTTLEFGFSVLTKDGRPVFQFHADPVALVREAHRKNSTIEIKDGIAILQSGSWELRFHADSGKLIQLQGVTEAEPTRTLICKLQPGGFAAEVEKVVNRGVSFHEEYDPEKPWTSMLRFALNECILQPATQRNNRTMLLRNRLESLESLRIDELLAKNRNEPKKTDRFCIPVSTEIAQNIKPESILFHPWSADTCFPRGSWPWTLVREYGFLHFANDRTDMKSGAGLELARCFHSPDSGPCALHAMSFYARGNPRFARRIGEMGLQRLSDEAFLQDMSCFLDGDLWAPKICDALGQFYPLLSDAELKWLHTSLPPATHYPLQKLIARRKSQPDENPREALRTVLLECWRETWRDQMEAEFTRLANTPVDRLAQQPAVPVSDAGKRSEAPAKPTLPGSLAEPATASETWQGLELSPR